jgi:hypothetical protein
MSSTEAELMALTESGREAVALRNLATQLGIFITDATVLKEDNDGANALAHNPVKYSKTKHIHIRYFYVRDLVEDKTVTVQRAPTTDMLADILTKPLHHLILAKHVYTMMCTGNYMPTP